MTKRLLVVAALLIVVIAGLATAIWYRIGTHDPVIAKVDNILIHESQADARIAGIAAVHKDITSALGPEWRSLVFQSLVDDVLMGQEARRAGIDVTKKDVDASLDSLRGRFPSEDDWRRFLEDQGIDQAELERRILLQLVGSRVYEEVTADVVPTEDELHAYFEAHQSDFTVDGEVQSFLQVRNSIEDTLTKQMQDEAFSAWLQQRRSEANVVVVSDEWR
ncbi:MAG TPA: hypothetical protein ENH00_00180 [Actinobacteria bacterium]|nr:peptidylprolyl isomerase [bacterium BMS3Bbin01]HDH24597.1 hypothetical protein [Actinomycetota bacterium]